MSVLLTSGMTAPTPTKAARVAALRRRWADATRHMRWDEANQLWQELMLEWLKPTAVNQRYWNDLLARRMAVLERREHRSTISDIEWDNTHQDMNR
jgi:hypothetical protein